VECVILIGLQASGKSTFWNERFRDTHVRINLDMLRTRHREALLLDACLRMKQPFVVDNTNPTRKDRRRYVAPAREAGFRVIGYFFRSRVEELLARNAARPEAQRVPDVAILGSRRRLVVPSCEEGFDELRHVRLADPSGFVVEEWRDEV
jgi:predicted kinase